MLDLEPGQVAAVGHRSQDRGISGGESHKARFSAAHGDTSSAEAGFNLQHTRRPNLLHYFVPGPLDI
jgi:hypothetical protein